MLFLDSTKDKKNLDKIKRKRPAEAGQNYKGISHSKLFHGVMGILGEHTIEKTSVVTNLSETEMFCSYVFTGKSKISKMFLADRLAPSWQFTVAVHNANTGKKALSSWLGLRNEVLNSSIVLCKGPVAGRLHSKGYTVNDAVDQIYKSITNTWVKDKFHDSLSLLTSVNTSMTWNELCPKGWQYGKLLNRLRLNYGDVFKLYDRFSQEYDENIKDLHQSGLRILQCFGEVALQSCTPWQQIPVLINGAKFFGNLDVSWY